MCPGHPPPGPGYVHSGLGESRITLSDLVRRSAVTEPCRVLLVSGSLRARSTNTAVVRTAQLVAPAGVAAIVYEGLADLPQFNPDDDVEPLPVAVDALRALIRGADALVFSTPEYAGSLPGSFKNALDWAIGDGTRGSIYEKPVAFINASPRGAANAHETLRVVLGYANATILEDACAHIPVTSSDLDEAGLVSDRDIRARIAEVLERVAADVARTAGSQHPS
jgi:chromate reductase, NAD(P)H dehydrogenase (quinone)